MVQDAREATVKGEGLTYPRGDLGNCSGRHQEEEEYWTKWSHVRMKTKFMTAAEPCQRGD